MIKWRFIYDQNYACCFSADMRIPESRVVCRRGKNTPYCVISMLTGMSNRFPFVVHFHAR